MNGQRLLRSPKISGAQLDTPAEANLFATVWYSSAVMPGLPPTMKSRGLPPIVPALEGGLKGVPERARTASGRAPASIALWIASGCHGAATYRAPT